ncbi:apiosidase-like domain-containing protein [Eisenbergiella sp.]
MRQYEMFELSYTKDELTENYANVDLAADFIKDGKKTTVKGIYAGNGIFKIRFLPEETGTYTYAIYGIFSDQGNEECMPADTDRHGMVRTDSMHFKYEDGTRYVPFGTTIYGLINQDKELIDATMDTLAEAPFNKVRFCVFPKHYVYNENEPRFYPFAKRENGSWDVDTPDLNYWEHFEQRLAELDQRGIEADIILFHPYDRWGFSSMSHEDDLKYVDYVVRRLCSFPNVWWSLANEYDLLMSKKTREGWEDIECRVADTDPFRHMLSNHNCFKKWDFTRENITHCSIQSKEFNRITDWRNKYKKPVIFDECCYEGNLPQIWGSISAKEMTWRFWRLIASGAYCTHGETFLDENDVIWWAKGGRLKGESPVRIAFLRKIVEELPGGLEPLPGRMDKISSITTEELELQKEYLPQEFKESLGAFFLMDDAERNGFLDSEHIWQAHIGDKVFLYFYDLRCYGEDELELPEDRTYQVEVIDSWEMTRVTVASGVSGKLRIKLPGKEGIAVLVTAV